MRGLNGRIDQTDFEYVKGPSQRRGKTLYKAGERWKRENLAHRELLSAVVKVRWVYTNVDSVYINLHCSCRSRRSCSHQSSSCSCRETFLDEWVWVVSLLENSVKIFKLRLDVWWSTSYPWKWERESHEERGTWSPIYVLSPPSRTLPRSSMVRLLIARVRIRQGVDWTKRDFDADCGRTSPCHAFCIRNSRCEKQS